MNVPLNAVCNTCTIQLISLCYKRAWWFRLLREPLLLIMRAMSWWHHIDPEVYRVRSSVCYGCIRFKKNALKDKSSTFRWLNTRIEPHFNRIRNSLLTENEIKRARQFAQKQLIESEE